MASAIGHLRGNDLGADDHRQLAEDQVRLGDVLGGDGVIEVAEGLTILDSTGFEQQGVHIFLAILEQGFELCGDVEALGGSRSHFSHCGLEVFGLFRRVDTGDHFRSQHANGFGDASSAEHCTRIFGPPGTRLGGEELSEFRILDREPDLAGVSVVGPECDGSAAIKLLPENLTTTGAVTGEHGIAPHGE